MNAANCQLTSEPLLFESLIFFFLFFFVSGRSNYSKLNHSENWNQEIMRVLCCVKLKRGGGGGSPEAGMDGETSFWFFSSCRTTLPKNMHFKQVTEKTEWSSVEYFYISQSFYARTLIYLLTAAVLSLRGGKLACKNRYNKH